MQAVNLSVARRQAALETFFEMTMQPKIKPSSDADWRKFYEEKCRAQRKEITALREALEVAINSVECASICPQTKEELPWYRKAKKALGGHPSTKVVFTNCNVCGIKLRTDDENQMGMCERCAAE